MTQTVFGMLMVIATWVFTGGIVYGLMKGTLRSHDERIWFRDVVPQYNDIP